MTEQTEIQWVQRGFEVVTGYDVELPKRSTARSAGYDIASAIDIVVSPGEVVLIPTGLKAFMNDDEYLALYIRSSVGVKWQLTMPNNVGIIDSDYYNNADNEGHMYVPVYNFGLDTQHIAKGERIAQGIFMKYLTVNNDDADGVRGGGLGSTGK